MFNPSGLLSTQENHAKTLLNSLNTNGYYLDLSQTGTGKTFVTSSIISNEKCPAYIICPRSVKTKWANTLQKFGVKTGVIINYELVGRGNTEYMKFKKLPNPDDETEKIELPEFRFPKDGIVVLDEGQRCKAIGSTNAQMLWALKKQGYRVAYISASAACSPVEMKSLGYLTDMHAYHNFRDFCLLNGATSNKFGAFNWDSDSKDAKRFMLNVHEYLFDKKQCASRLTRGMFPDFPDSVVVSDAYDMGPVAIAINGTYEAMEVELAMLDSRAESYSTHVFAIIMEARRRTEILKVPAIVELIEKAIDEGESSVIFVNYKDTIDAIFKRLTKPLQKLVCRIVGGQNDKERDSNTNAFQSDVARIALCNIAAGGVAIDLHDVNGKHPRQSVINPGFNPHQLLQALGRVWRAGGKSKSHQRVLFAANTIEERCAKACHFKLNNLELLNDGELAISPFELALK